MLISLRRCIILVHVVANTTPIYVNKLININTAYALYNCIEHDIEYLIICQLKLPISSIDSFVDLHTISRKCILTFLN